MSVSETIRNRIKTAGGRYWAGDNISEYIYFDEYDRLIEETASAFEQVLDALVIDRETDPNSKGTAKRLAKKIGRAHV